MTKSKVLEEVAAEAPNRRKFLSNIALAGAAAAAIGAGARNASAQAAAPTDADILNFALNLEYLEAEFYTLATSGKTIDQMGVGITGSGTPGPTTGGQQVPGLVNGTLPSSDIANEIAFDERAHVTFIRTALMGAGAMPIAKPAINLNALGIGFGGLTDFLQLARAFEDVGVTAYAGAAPLITDKTILGAAAKIAEVEALHAGNIRLQVAKLGIPTTLLDGADILPPPSGQKYFAVDSNALTMARTPGQVLFLVYGGQANATSGGFFPNGFNGTINMSSAGVAITNTTNASVTPNNITTNQAMITLNSSASTSASGQLTYLIMVAPGGLVPAILQTPNSPMAVIQFVNGPGTYLLQLVVTDGAGNRSTQNISLTYKP